MKYRVHRLDIKMTSDQRKLEQFLDSLEGEVVGIIPNVTIGFFVGSPGGFCAHRREAGLSHRVAGERSLALPSSGKPPREGSRAALSLLNRGFLFRRVAGACDPA